MIIKMRLSVVAAGLVAFLHAVNAVALPTQNAALDAELSELSEAASHVVEELQTLGGTYFGSSGGTRIARSLSSDEDATNDVHARSGHSNIPISAQKRDGLLAVRWGSNGGPGIGPPGNQGGAHQRSSSSLDERHTSEHASLLHHGRELTHRDIHDEASVEPRWGNIGGPGIGPPGHSDGPHQRASSSMDERHTSEHGTRSHHDRDPTRRDNREETTLESRWSIFGGPGIGFPIKQSVDQRDTSDDEQPLQARFGRIGGPGVGFGAGNDQTINHRETLSTMQTQRDSSLEARFGRIGGPGVGFGAGNDQTISHRETLSNIQTQQDSSLEARFGRVGGPGIGAGAGTTKGIDNRDFSVEARFDRNGGSQIGYGTGKTFDHRETNDNAEQDATSLVARWGLNGGNGIGGNIPAPITGRREESTSLVARFGPFGGNGIGNNSPLPPHPRGREESSDTSADVHRLQKRGNEVRDEINNHPRGLSPHEGHGHARSQQERDVSHQETHPSNQPRDNGAHGNDPNKHRHPHQPRDNAVAVIPERENGGRGNGSTPPKHPPHGRDAGETHLERDEGGPTNGNGSNRPHKPSHGRDADETLLERDEGGPTNGNGSNRPHKPSHGRDADETHVERDGGGGSGPGPGNGGGNHDPPKHNRRDTHDQAADGEHLEARFDFPPNPNWNTFKIRPRSESETSKPLEARFDIETGHGDSPFKIRPRSGVAV